jgi:uncharacterized protein (TIGR00251 family)
MNFPSVQDTKNGVLLTIHVQPNARITEYVGLHGDALKIRVAAPPTEGAANDELIRFLARQCSLPLASVHIQSGRGSKHKRIVLKGVTAGLVIARLNLGAEKGGVTR